MVPPLTYWRSWTRTLVRQALDGMRPFVPLDVGHHAHLENTHRCKHSMQLPVTQVPCHGLLEALFHEHKVVPCRGQEGKHGDIVLTRPADSLLQLTAAIYSITVWQDSGAAVNTKNADVHLDKRLRVITFFAYLIMQMHA